MKKVNPKYYSHLTKNILITGLGVCCILIYRLLINFPIKYLLDTLWTFNNVTFALLYTVFDCLIILLVYLTSLKPYKYLKTGMILIHIPVFYDLFNILSFVIAGKDRCYYVNSYLNYDSNGLLLLRVLVLAVAVYYINQLIRRGDKETTLVFYTLFIFLLLYLVI